MKEAREYIGPQRKVHTVLACTEITESKPVRLETSCTKILPPPGEGSVTLDLVPQLGSLVVNMAAFYSDDPGSNPLYVVCSRTMIHTLR